MGEEAALPFTRRPHTPDVAGVTRVLNALGGPAKIQMLLSGHSHFDHSFDTATWSRLTGARIIGPKTTCLQAEAEKIPAARCTAVFGMDRRRRHHRAADPADPGVPAGPAAGGLDRLVGADPDDRAADQEAAGVHRLPDGAAGHHPVPAGPEPRLDAADPQPRPRGRPRRRPGDRGLRQADDGRQLRHRGDRLRHPGGGELRRHHQGLGPDRRGGRPLHPGLHARQADGHRRRPVGRA